MNARSLPPLVAGVVAIVVGVTRHLPAILNRYLASVPAPRELSLYLLTGRAVSFLLVFGLLFGTAYWTGRRLDVREEYPAITLLAGAGAVLGYLLAYLVFVFPEGLSAFHGLALRLALVGGSALGVGVTLATVTLAGLGLASFRPERQP